ncbi:precorrin-2 C(20)-methyltransferase [Pontibacterium sp.]|uniref:precorrin-2 C(20)-methyltransferase n=1 Tax=Pontibacterium sp. TaxID=2036026 RepID=UPI003567CC1B
MSRGCFYGVGVGPGDPELITLKALRLIQNAAVVSYLANDSGQSQARAIACEAFANVPAEQIEIAINMPMSTDRRLANQAYDEGAEQIRQQLDAGRDVVFLCEGDPLFFGSFAYLLERLQSGFECQVVPGISSVHAASAALQAPLTMLKESFVVVSGRHSDEQIRTALQQHDSVVIMKAGQARPRILALLEETGRNNDARYLEYIGRENQRVESSISELANEVGPYFSLFVITRQERNSR